MFGALQKLGDVSQAQMYLAFNMGLGFVLVVPPSAADQALGLLREAGEDAVVVGEIVAGSERVVIEGLE